jgi:hypothetical protein
MDIPSQLFKSKEASESQEFSTFQRKSFLDQSKEKILDRIWITQK